MKRGKKFEKTILKQPTLNFQANPGGPYSTAAAATSTPMPSTSPPTTTTREKDFEIITNRLEKMCDNLREELESKLEDIKENLENWKVYSAGLIVDKTNDCMDKNCDTKFELDTKLNKSNASIDELIDSVNQIRNDLDGIRNHYELLTNKLATCEEKVDTIEKGCEPVKTKIDHLTETLLKDGFNENQNQVKCTKDETKIVLNRLPNKPNILPQALLASLHILLGLPMMLLNVSGLDSNNSALMVELGTKENCKIYSKQLKQGLKRLQKSKPKNHELIRISKLSIEPFLEESLNCVKRKMKTKASEFFNNLGLRSHRFIRTEDNFFMDRNCKTTIIEDNGKEIITTSSEHNIFPFVWALKARTPENLEEDTESLRMIAMDEKDNLIDVTALMNGFENYAYNEDFGLLTRKH